MEGVLMSELITTSELCELLKVDRMMLYRLRNRGMPFIRLGTKIVRYDLEVVLQWLSENTVFEEKG
jgi:excisionase family DNA binding protein